MNFAAYLDQQKQYIDNMLKIFLPSENNYPETIHRAINYSIFAGGKRFRPILVIETALAFECTKEDVANYACAVEFLHTYSLIHDDLPALDNDDYRRNKPTNHKVFGEDIAILAGDALLTLAFETIAKDNPLCNNAACQTPYTKIKIMQELARAGGTFGMIGGQVVDLESEGKEIDIETLNYIHKNKTGALITSCLRIGAIAAGVNEKQLEDVTEFGNKIGLLYQIVDDILDVTGDEDKLGKKVGSDENNKKATYPSLLGLEKSREISEQIAREAEELLRHTDLKTGFFKNLIFFLLNRQY